MRRHWWMWWRPSHVGDSGEACTQLERLRGRDAQVAQLGAELRETQQRNNFSGMVQQAIARTAQEGR